MVFFNKERMATAIIMMPNNERLTIEINHARDPSFGAQLALKVPAYWTGSFCTLIYLCAVENRYQ